jgi:7-carboxy-7-deazaguanine synthase
MKNAPAEQSAPPPKSSRLRVAEIFASIQGEGIWVGTPSVFIRVSGCNLRCVWCDTPYASWQPEGPIQAIDEIVAEATRHGIGHIVLTGGEPMLFDPIEELAARLKARGHTLTIETAGTFYRDLPCDLMSISPKLANSTPPEESGWRDRHETTRQDRKPLRRLVERYPFQLKFVVDPEQGDDVAEIEGLLSELPAVPPDRVLLMPEGTDAETLRRRQRLLVPIAMKRNWRITPRLHIELFGNTKGT